MFNFDYWFYYYRGSFLADNTWGTAYWLPLTRLRWGHPFAFKVSRQTLCGGRRGTQILAWVFGGLRGHGQRLQSPRSYGMDRMKHPFAALLSSLALTASAQAEVAFPRLSPLAVVDDGGIATGEAVPVPFGQPLEVLDRSGARWDIQLKGSGRTPFSRGGDGKAAQLACRSGDGNGHGTLRG